MKTIHYLLYVFALFLPFFALAQVGIGTTNPNAQLDIAATNAATPTNTDGILIPKIDEFPVTNPTAAQDGMMVFITGNGSEAKGFYYWNNSTNGWVTIIGTSNSIQKINDLTDAKSDYDGTDDGSSIFLGINAGANDDGTNNLNIGIGLNSLTSNVDGVGNTGIGNNSMRDNVDGLNNIALGMNALRDNINGSGNIAIGVGSIFDNANSNYNVAVGDYALATGNGNNNVAVGYNAGVAATGSANVFLGYRSGLTASGSNKLYIENSAATNPLIYGEFDNDILRINGTLQIGNPTGIGYAFPSFDGTASQVLQTDGSGNVDWVNVTSFGAEEIDDLLDGKTDTNKTSIFLGVNAGANDDSDNYNIGIGPGALQANIAGGSNIAIGENALSLNSSTGFQNVGIGSIALRNNSGNYNVSVGGESMLFNSVGENNVALGRRALYGNNGSDNVAVGWRSGHSSGTGSYNVFIGAESGHNETGNNKLYIENTNADSNNALIYGEFDNNFLGINGTTNFGGASYWKENNISGTTVASIFNVGDDGGLTISNGGLAQHFIYGGGTTVFNLQELDTDFRISGDTNTNLFFVDASTDRVGIRNSLPVMDLYIKQSSTFESSAGGIGLESNSSSNNWKIYHSGIHFSFAENGTRRAYITAATGAYVQTSDRNLKKNISKAENMLSKLSAMDIYSYHYKDQDPSEEKTLGVMAQEVKPIFPELVSTDETGYLGMNYAGLSVVAIKAIKEQQVIIDQQQLEIETLKKDIAKIKKLLKQ